MRNRLKALQIGLRDSYWFIPAVMTLVAFVVSNLMLNFDRFMGGIPEMALQLGDISAASAQTLLSTIASSIITIAGTVFSLTMVVLTLASQQYGPLLLGNFLRDRSNQAVLGTFTATFLYCLQILSAVREPEEFRFVPRLSVSLAVVLGVVSVFVLIYFIHHVSVSIRYNNIIAYVRAKLMEAIDEEFSVADDPHWTPIVPDPLPEDFTERAVPLRAHKSGYVQLVDEQELLGMAVERNLILKLRRRPGQFLTRGTVLAYAYPPERVEESLDEHCNEALHVGEGRTPEQDIELLFTQLVTIAVRALSPAVNDPYTAIACLDGLSEALCEIGRRRLPSPAHKDHDGHLRLLTNPVTFEHLVYLSFDQIHTYGSGDLVIVTHLLRKLRDIGECLHDQPRQAMLRRYTDRVRHDSLARHTSNHAREVIEQAYHDATRTLSD